MKKNRMMRLASILLVAVLLSTSVISGTYAKYTSTVTGSSTATVAKWSIKVSDTAFSDSNTGTEIAVASPSVTFNLFNTIKDNWSESGAANEADVSSGKIAPGTSGAFALNIKNDSEVTAQYGITFELTNNSGVPLEFKVGNGEWTSTLEAVAMADATKLDIGEATTVNVQWRWVFERGDTTEAKKNNNKSDTTLGITAQGTAPVVTIAATITVDQVD